MVLTVFGLEGLDDHEDDGFSVLPETVPSVEVSGEPLERISSMLEHEGMALPRPVETDEGFVYDVADLAAIVAGLERALEDESALEDEARAWVQSVLQVFRTALDHRVPGILRV